MYSSDLTQKKPKDSFDAEELDRVISYINGSRSDKLSISSGGEPFLKIESIIRMLSKTETPYIELNTAGHWAKTQTRAASVLRMLSGAIASNINKPKVAIRLSVDDFHINAPRGVPLQNHANIIKAWQETDQTISVGIRSLDSDWNKIDFGLAEILGADIEEVNDWNRKLRLNDGSTIPITYSTLRLTGAAAKLKAKITPQKSVKEYFKPFENEKGLLVPATLMNDAVNGNYESSNGLSMTLDSDGSIWIFCGTSPDRRATFGHQSFQETVAYFVQDPITQLLLTEGVWKLVEIVEEYDPVHAHNVIQMNDLTCIVEELLKDEKVRLFSTLKIIKKHHAAGRDI